MMHITTPAIMDSQLITAHTITMTATVIIQVHQRIVSVMQPTATAINTPHTPRIIIITTKLTITNHIRTQFLMLATMSTQEITSMDTTSIIEQTML